MPPALKSNKIVAALQFAAQKGLDVDDALDQLTELASANPRKSLLSIKTEIGTSANGDPVLVGWDVCSECKQHITHCQCSSGPVCPDYIKRWVAEEAAKYQTVTEAVKSYGAAPTPVGSPENAKVPFSPEAGSVSTEDAIPAEGTERCKGCGNVVTSEVADENDDGTWSCYACQAAGV